MTSRVIHRPNKMSFKENTTTPENLIENKMYQRMLLSSVYQEKLVALVVDEVHCVQSWVKKFRKSF